MGKVIRFELKKLVSRIGIYILVILMAGLLVAGAFMYDPIKRPDTTLSLIGESVIEKHSNFIDDGLKDDCIATVEEIAINAETYVKTSANYIKYNNADEINALFTKFDEYCILYNEATATPTEYNTLLVGINESFDKLKDALDSTLKHSKDANGYYILTTSSNYIQLYSLISDIDINFNSPSSHKIAGETYYNEYREPLKNCLQDLIYPNLEDTATKYTTTGTFYSIITLRMKEIVDKMQIINQQAIDDELVNIDNSYKQELDALFNRYVNCATIFVESYNSSMCVEALYNVKSKTDRSNLIGYGDVSLYDMEETATEYEYYITHHSNPNDFANSLSVTHTSNTKTNAYDFSFFVMSLFGVLVIIFAIYLSANTISGEINNNTMRFTAIRPVKRGSLFFGKYLAIIIMSTILLLFGTIASFVVGGILYGFNSANILMIINSDMVMVAHPLAVLGIFVLSLILLTSLYSAFTMMLSSVIKSDLLVMVISIVFYIINLILPLFFGAGSWLRFYPFVNINLFAYFGSNRFTTDSVLGQLFNNVVYHGISLWISLVYIIGITALLLWIGRTIFKKREL